MAAGCHFCDEAGGREVVRTAAWRVVHATEPGLPAFYRLVWNAHVKEFSQLAAGERHACVDALAAIEQAMLRHFAPDKVNLASLGNAVPHLHWHVVARFTWDSHFPAPVWAASQRAAAADRVARVEAALPAFEEDLRRQFAP